MGGLDDRLRTLTRFTNANSTDQMKYEARQPRLLTNQWYVRSSTKLALGVCS